MVSIIKNLFYLSTLVALVAVAVVFYSKHSNQQKQVELEKWADTNKITIDKNKVKSKQFKIEFDQKEWDLLVKKLELTKYFEPMDRETVPAFEYGFDPEYAKELVDYWRTKFNWQKQVANLNRFPQFKIEINGTTVHYVHFRTNSQKKDLKVIPILLIDGWPGSFFGFYKMIDYLSENFKDLSLDIIVPSIPGYLYSTPLNKPVDPIDTVFIFDALVRYIHGPDVQYYVHGEDWGSIITTYLAQLYPNRVRGIHITMAIIPDIFDFNIAVYSLFGPLFPSYFYTPEELNSGFDKRFTLGSRLLVCLKDLGYMHLQATWPDSVGHGLTDSPVGLLAYIMEKYSSWSFDFETEISGKPDGGLNKYNRDDLLTITTLYWMSNSITSSIRLYRYLFAIVDFSWPKGYVPRLSVSQNVSVSFQNLGNDIFFYPRSILAIKYPNLHSYQVIRGGGHFAAFQNPKSTSDHFVNLISQTQ